MHASVNSPAGMVSSADRLASQAGAAILRRGGTAVDAVIATNAVLAATGPHMCGLGGDLFALVHRPGQAPATLRAVGRAGSGADPRRLREEGRHTMPLSGDIRSATVPGCVDGWMALHHRFGRLELSEVLAAGIDRATQGFAVSPLLRRARQQLDDRAPDELRTGESITRPGVARTLSGIADHGRESFYSGEFGSGLVAMSQGEFTSDDLIPDNAVWVDPVAVTAWGHQVWAPPAPSQGYVTLASLAIAEQLPLPADPDHPQWAHLLVEAARAAGHDRPDRLFGTADVAELLTAPEIARRAGLVHPDRRAPLSAPTASGDTTYMCAVDSEGVGVSLIQSNASNFGTGLFEPGTGIGLQNRGLGFSLRQGHPGEYGPGKLPAHTLTPTLVTRSDGNLRAVAGTQGGDTQPQVMLQVLTRLLRHDSTPAAAVVAPRWRLSNVTGFDTWTGDSADGVDLEDGVPEDWRRLSEWGHHVTDTDAERGFGHAQLIELTGDGLAGAADPRTLIGEVSVA